MLPNPISTEYLTGQLIRMMNDESSSIRSKTLRVLAQIIQRDINLFNNVRCRCLYVVLSFIIEHMQMMIKTEIHNRLFDSSTAVREAALDFLGKYVTISQEGLSFYFDMIIESTSVSTFYLIGFILSCV